jgi:hypothetical protein
MHIHIYTRHAHTNHMYRQQKHVMQGHDTQGSVQRVEGAAAYVSRLRGAVNLDLDSLGLGHGSREINALHTTNWWVLIKQLEGHTSFSLI